MHKRTLIVLAAGFCVGLTALAQQASKSAPKANVVAGKELFRQHCSACHGVDAKGGGTMHDPLSADPSKRVPPTDLTVLSQRNAGTFPADRVRDSIHSKGPIRAHGTPEMPAWGDVFYSLKSDPKRLEGRVRDLTAYIESLQVAKK